MNPFKIPSFGEQEFQENRVNNSSVVYLIKNADAKAYQNYVNLFISQEYELFEEYTKGNHSYTALKHGDDGAFINYFENIGELYLILEQKCRYFSFKDNKGDEICTSNITQIHLEDFGMSYVIRLSDGRFIIIDGGRDFEPDAKSLYECLKKYSINNTPVIASWIFSHPHSDHYFCFLEFMNHYKDKVKIESFMLNFPEADDLEHYPALAIKNYRFVDSSGTTNIPRMWNYIKDTEANVYMAHTGQRYTIGNASCEILASIDDTIHQTKNINATSLVIRMEICSQVILWATDASFSDAKLPERYGSYLKADILQIPHHGFQCGDPKVQIEGYDLIRPEVCFLPVSLYNAYTAFSAHKESTRYLMTQEYACEFITGDPERTITLPYTPLPHSRKEHERQFKCGQKRSGANTWIFTGLNTSIEDDFVFTILNMTHNEATVTIELFFESSENLIRSIKASAQPLTVKSLNIVGDEIDDDFEYFDWLSLKKKGIPKEADFAVRFMSDTPLVISHPEHRAAYKSNDD